MEVSSIVAVAVFVAVYFLPAMNGALFWPVAAAEPAVRTGLDGALFNDGFFDVVFRRSCSLANDGMIQPGVAGVAGAIGSADEPTRSSRPIVQHSL